MKVDRVDYIAMSSQGDLIRRGCEELDIPCSEAQVNQFLTYLAELKKWNKAYNLTGLKTDRDIVVKHFLDSLLFLKVLPAGTGTVADVGSGAGFPGIPLKIMLPAVKMFLLEPVQKKAIFLRHVCGILGLRGVEVMDRRIEDVEGLCVDAAMTRALFSIGDFAETAKGIVRKDGLLILSKGPKIEDELKGREMENITVTDYKLPFTETVRHLVVVRL